MALAALSLVALALGACGTIPENDPLRAGPSTPAESTPAESAPAETAPAETAPAETGVPASPGASEGAASPSGGSESGASGTERCEYEPAGDAAKAVRPPSPTGVKTSGTVAYDLTMTEGTVRITLDPARAPCTVHSFESLADQGYFDATRCHRLVDSGLFLFQCGDPTATGTGGPGYSFADELDGTESYTKGVVAMANSGPNTNGSQFFLVYRDSTSLDQNPDYTIFGEIDEAGIGVLERMAVEGQDGSIRAGGGRPNNPSEIESVSRVGG